MNQGLGLHLCEGDRVEFALVASAAGRPPKLLESGTAPLSSLTRALREVGIPTAVPVVWTGRQTDGHRLSEEPTPIRQPVRAALTVAAAVAHWEWCQGRLQEDDLLLRVEGDHLDWCLGEPTGGKLGSMPRRGPAGELLDSIPSGIRSVASAAYLAGEDDASVQLLASACARCRLPPRQAPHEEIDRAAAGAALAAAQPPSRLLRRIQESRSSRLNRRSWFVSLALAALLAATTYSARAAAESRTAELERIVDQLRSTQAARAQAKAVLAEIDHHESALAPHRERLEAHHRFRSLLNIALETEPPAALDLLEVRLRPSDRTIAFSLEAPADLDYQRDALEGHWSDAVGFPVEVRLTGETTLRFDGVSRLEGVR